MLRADPKFFQAQFNLAIAYRAEGEDEKALAALRRAREIARGRSDTRDNGSTSFWRGLTGEPVPAAAAQERRRRRQRGGGGDLQRGRGDLPLPSDRRLAHRPHRMAGRPRREGLLREFPMAGMPPIVRQKFVDRIRGGMRQAKSDHQVTDG